MSHAITRIYDTAEKAASAIKQLQYQGFSDSAITSIAPHSGSSADSITAALTAGWVLKANAKIYATEVLKGRWLVSILAPFGKGILAEHALDRFAPVPSEVGAVERPLRWDEAAPLSSALGFPPLWRGPMPNTSLGIPTLSTPNWSLSQALGLPLISRSSGSRLNPQLAHFTLSSKIGLPLLTRSAGRA